MSEFAQVVAVAIIAPTILALVNAWITRSTRRETWDREDVVSARLEATNAAIAKNADQLEAHGHQLAGIKAVADTTHVLVNSEKDETLRRVRNGLQSQIVMLRRLNALSEAAGVSVPEEDRRLLEGLVHEVIALEAMLATRAVAQGLIGQ